MGVWIPLAEEAETVRQLFDRGWAVTPGERFRFRAPPGIRVTTTDLSPDDAGRLAADISQVISATTATYSG